MCCVIEFGVLSTSLAAGLVFGALVVGLLLSAPRNVAANRLLAAFIAVFALKLLPYVLGFAGFYDAYPWLSFAPTSFGLALGPLLYLHVRRLSQSAMPAGWGWHLLPAAVQAAYYCVMFAQPLAVKDAFAERFDGPLIDPAETWLELASLAIYLWLARRHFRAYQAWLDAQFSNREQLRQPWIRHVLRLLMVLLPCWVVFEAASALGGFDYFQRYPLYLVISAWVTFLGLQGWRYAEVEYPVPAATQEPSPGEAAVRETIATTAASRDWAAQGQAWQQQLAAAGWWRDPDLSLPRLARHLGTNTAYLSRALNEGLGRSFNAVVNDLRVEAVKQALSRAEAVDLLQLGLAVGFNSKSSFNRVFKASTGQTPSQFRRRALAERPNA